MEKSYTLAEEIAHAITHGVGLLFSVAAMTLLIVFSNFYGDIWHLISTSIYGVTLVLLYGASTMYHALPSSNAKRLFRTLDHSAIYLLIAGTFTPYLLVNLRGPWGWTLLGVEWSLALFGVFIEAFAKEQAKKISLVLYLGLGWSAAIALRPLLDHVATGGLVLLLLGGLAYTGGVVFYVWTKLPYHHAIWHLFVLAGSTFHFFSVLLYVIPIAGR